MDVYFRLIKFETCIHSPMVPVQNGVGVEVVFVELVGEMKQERNLLIRWERVSLEEMREGEGN